MAIVDLVRERGPLTVAAFMELALYDSRIGYYARAARRSGRAGDFFTSVDVGSIFGELVEIQLAEMAQILHAPGAFDLVEAGPLARAAQPSTLGEVGERLATSAGEVPLSFEGALLANELLDAFPVH